MILETKLGELTDEQGGETHKLGKMRTEAWKHPQPRGGRKTVTEEASSVAGKLEKYCVKEARDGQGFNSMSARGPPTALGGQVRLIPVERVVLALHFSVGGLNCPGLECTFLREPERSCWIPG